ncbi:MAG: hypothetical protein JWN86_1941 [Planctomycetota bacterium]|nr:hypothetical protein [Planctomycetota bacterium]
MRHRRPGEFAAIGLLVSLATVFGPALFVRSQGVLAQTPAPPTNPAQTTPKPSDPARPKVAAPADTEAQESLLPPMVGSLTAKYRLQERFTSKDVKSDSGLLGQYQVGFREKISVDDAPDKEPRITHAIYTERPAVVSPVDDKQVNDLVRHYTLVKITPDTVKNRKDQKLYDDLSIWYRRESIDTPPQVLVLTPKRTLREEEYTFAITYDFVTNFAYLLPDRPVQIADTWKVERAGAMALINDEHVRGGKLTGKLTEIRNHGSVKGMHLAIINITGKLETSDSRVTGDIAVNARLQFAFMPVTAQDGREIEAFGAIEKLSLAQASEYSAPGLTKSKAARRELIFERKRPGPEPLLAIPNPIPKATPENSWLTFTDTKGRFQFRHPQEFQPDTTRNTRGTVVLARFHSDLDDDIVTLEFVEKPQARPETLFKQLVDDWRSKGVEVVGGQPEKLPAADWPGMSVHHMEAALKPPDQGGRPAARPYVDAYSVQFPRNVAIQITATTFQEDPAPFRDQVRGMLKTLRLGEANP